jgi:hypothetical protein
VDDDAQMFFVLTAAIHDAGIAAWDAKRVFDSVRPVTAIPFLFHGQTIMAWGGPYMGAVAMNFEMGDLVGRATGRLVASQAWFSGEPLTRIKFRWPRLSAQYHKAWAASFPPDL